MIEDGRLKFEAISPVFPVSDIPRALTFYRDGLGFDIDWTWGDPPTHANVCRGNVSISLALDVNKAGKGDAYIAIQGVDTYYAELRSRSLVGGEISDRPYAMRDFSVVDPSGNRVVFGEPIAR